MPSLFTLELPKDAGAAAGEIQRELAQLDGVARSGMLAARSIDPVSIGVWVQMAAGACLIEGTNVSEGRGTTRPFELIGGPGRNAAFKLQFTRFKVNPGGIDVQCGDGVLRLTELQRAGGRRMHTVDFLRGYKLSPGDRFGA